MAIAVIAAAGLTSFAWGGGYIAPNPFRGNALTPPPAEFAEVDGQTQLFLRIRIPNYSNRTVRLTSVSAVGSGFEVSRVEGLLEQPPDPGDCFVSDDGSSVSCVSETTAWTPGQPAEGAAPLPLDIPQGPDLELFVWLDLKECEQAREPTSLALTMDFGEGEFPSWSRTLEYPNVIEPLSSPMLLEDWRGETDASSLAGRCSSLFGG